MSEESRNSVAMGVSMLGMYMQAVIQDQGLDKALYYYYQMGQMFGKGNVASFKAKSGDETPTPEILHEIFTENLTRFGSDFKITANPDGIDMNINHCAIYQGFSMAGFDNDTISKICKRGGEGQMDAITAVYPKLEPFSTPRSHLDGVCIEGYKIKR